ncbi:MAG: hypothetical protein KKA62_00925 [Nanoarchaeota archaeon]|nr:hypothetical protein [Nanoarchaeota archaeon]MBU1644493.1 hypothetical protein [Nanoarchaeota archaeon]MBU1976497.1 hypothetical protein [Nanoarchaeota archaeon]
MSYYCLNNFKEENLSKIEELASGLKVETAREDERGNSWTCHPYPDEEKTIFISYNRFEIHGYPVLVQTFPAEIDHTDPIFRPILKRLIKICEPTNICDGACKEYNLNLFK